MANLTRGQTFAVTETVTNTKLHNLVDLATISSIVDADIDPSAAIQFSKLLASSISGALLTNLDLIPSGANKIPFANLNVPFGSSYVSLVTIPNQSLQPLALASWVDGASFRNLASIPGGAGQLAYQAVVQSLASGGIPVFNGVSAFVGSPKSGTQVFTGDSIFVVPAGITKGIIAMVGGGGGGGGGGTAGDYGGGGGGGGESVTFSCVALTPLSSITIQVGDGGTGGAAGGANDGSAGQDSVFDLGGLALTAKGGGGGKDSIEHTGGAGGTGGAASMNASGTTAGLQGEVAVVGGAGATGTGDGGGGGGTLFGSGGAGSASSGTAGSNAAANSGGGGGGCKGSAAGGNGGSGVVIITY